MPACSCTAQQPEVNLVRVEDRGGAVGAMEQGFQKSEIEQAAYSTALEIDSGERVVVGVNRFVSAQEEPYEPMRVERDGAAVDRALEELRVTAKSPANVMVPMREALRLRATGGEVADALRDVWGQYVPTEHF